MIAAARSQRTSKPDVVCPGIIEWTTNFSGPLNGTVRRYGEMICNPLTIQRKNTVRSCHAMHGVMHGLVPSRSVRV